jgi:chromosome transmission fidelity protein 1
LTFLLQQGKSLSLISATLTFLRDAKTQARASLIASIRSSLAGSMVKEPEWVIEREIETKVRELERQERELEERLAEIRARERKEREREGKVPRKRAVSFISGLEKGAWQADAREAEQKLTHETSERVASSDEEFAPDPYYEAHFLSSRAPGRGPSLGVSSAHACERPKAAREMT